MSFVQDIKLARDYIGKSAADIPVPAFVVDRAKIRQNSNRMLEKIRALKQQYQNPSHPKKAQDQAVETCQSKVEFRVHVETLKATEVVRQELNNGEVSRVVVSTLEEIRQLVQLVEEGVVKDVLYSTPVGKSQVKELAYLKNLYSNLGATLRLVVDNLAQLEFLLSNSSNWSVMIKIDIEQDVIGHQHQHSQQDSDDDSDKYFSPDFDSLLTAITSDSKINNKIQLFGFYCHAGASCGTDDLSISQQDVNQQLGSVVKAAAITRHKLLKRKQHLQTIKTTNNNITDPDCIPFTISIGATPTVHHLDGFDQILHHHDTLELHAGSYVALDLRQIHASLDDMAGVVLSEICSYRPSKREYVINAGVLALARENGSLSKGHAKVKGAPNWAVTRVYQEHAIISQVEGDEPEDPPPFSIGDRIVLYPQNTCITSSCHRLYFVVEGNDKIVDIWQPWRYW